MHSSEQEARVRPPRAARGCAWCGRRIDTGAETSGRPRRYCSQSCRQRAYEQRRSGAAVPEGALVLTAGEAGDLMDRVFALRCRCEDLRTALDEGAPVTDLQTLAAELVAAAHDAERLR